MNQTIKIILVCFIAFLLVLAWWSSLTIGLSSDEYFHHINGLNRYNFLFSLGEDKNFQFRNTQFYPGLYDTLSYTLGRIIMLISIKFYANNIDFVMHLINIIFSTLSLVGLYFFSKKIFNKDIGIIAVFLTLLNPFFFGHMGMNSKDIVIFFSLIWFCYYFYLYCTEEKKIIKNLLLASFFIGFGCGVRLTFLVVIFPVVVCGLVYLFIKFKSQYLYLTKRLLPHSLIAIAITIFLVILCWPHMIVEIQNGNFVKFFSTIVKNTINWIDGPKIGMLNGEYYEVFNTPKSYFLSIILYRIPFYFTLLIILSYFLMIGKNLLIKTEISNFNKKFLIINIIAFFPIFLALILSVNIYDNLRLFLFIIPFFSIIAAFSLNWMLTSFKNSFKIKTILTMVVILFSLSFYRFITLTPYQYDYINYSSIKYSNAAYKWEHDYWGTSFKELVKKIKKQYSKEQIRDLKITKCSGDDTLLYYLRRQLGLKFIYRFKREKEANHVVIINRTTLDIFNPVVWPKINKMVNKKGHMLVRDVEKVVRTPGVKTTCPKQYPGTDVVTVERNGVVLSALRKLDK